MLTKELQAYLFDDQAHVLSAPMTAWLASSRRFATFVSNARDKIRKKIRTCLKEHKKLDGRKPAELDRKQQLAKATDTLQKEFERIDKFLKTATPRAG